MAVDFCGLDRSKNRKGAVRFFHGPAVLSRRARSSASSRGLFQKETAQKLHGFADRTQAF
jgi:hypothetical protein